MKILLIDDDQIVRECLESLISKSGGTKQLLVASTLEQGLRLVAEGKTFEIALVNLAPGGNSLEPVKRFHAVSEGAALVMLANAEDEELVLQALDAGAIGFINKAASTRAMKKALREVLNGGIYVPVSVLTARGLYNSKSGLGPDTHVTVSLLATGTNQNSELFRLMLLGCSNRAIAQRLRLKEQVVRDRISAWLKELDVTNRSEAILVIAAA